MASTLTQIAVSVAGLANLSQVHCYQFERTIMTWLPLSRLAALLLYS